MNIKTSEYTRPSFHSLIRTGRSQSGLNGLLETERLNPLPVISVASARICCEGDRRVVFQAGPTEGVLNILQDRPYGYKER